jgi:hypothetical protein
VLPSQRGSCVAVSAACAIKPSRIVVDATTADREVDAMRAQVRNRFHRIEFELDPA